MTVPSSITASIVTYNSGPVIGLCLDHLVRSTTRSLEIVIWDNASRDDTATQLAPWKDRLQVTFGHQNLGFGQGHNAALAQAGGDYFLILNPDIELPPGSLDFLADHLDKNPACGAVSPLLQEGDGTCGFSLKYPGHRYAGRTFAGLPGKYAMLQGACLLVRADVYRAIGGFDAGFFLYAEDLDISLRIRKHGFELHCLESLKVKHIGGHSERSFTPKHVSAKKQLGIMLFYRKHYPWSSRLVLVGRDLLKSSWRALTLCLARRADRVARRQEHLGRLRGTFAYLRGTKRL